MVFLRKDCWPVPSRNLLHTLASLDLCSATSFVRQRSTWLDHSAFQINKKHLSSCGHSEPRQSLGLSWLSRQHPAFPVQPPALGAQARCQVAPCGHVTLRASQGLQPRCPLCLPQACAGTLPPGSPCWLVGIWLRAPLGLSLGSGQPGSQAGSAAPGHAVSSLSPGARRGSCAPSVLQPCCLALPVLSSLPVVPCHQEEE